MDKLPLVQRESSFRWQEELHCDLLVAAATKRLRLGFGIFEEVATEEAFSFWEAPRQQLDSFAAIGLFRSVEDEAVDEQYTSHEVVVHTSQVAQEREDNEDWLLDYSSMPLLDGLGGVVIDFETGIEEEIIDAKSSVVAAPQGVYVSAATIDGLNQRDYNAAIIYDSVRSTESRFLFASHNTGIYHSVEVRTENPGDSFYIRALELELMYSGVGR